MKHGIIIRTLTAALLLGIAAARLGAVEAPAPKVVLVDYSKVMAGYAQLTDFNKRIEGQVQQVKNAITLKATAREAMVKQANEIAAGRTKETSDDEFRAKIQPLVAAVEATEKEIRDLQAAPELNKEIADATNAFRVNIREAVEAETDAVGADVAIDLASVNADGLAIVVPAKASKLADISDSVLARLNAKPAEAKPAEPAPVDEKAPSAASTK